MTNEGKRWLIMLPGRDEDDFDDHAVVIELTAELLASWRARATLIEKLHEADGLVEYVDFNSDAEIVEYRCNEEDEPELYDTLFDHRYAILPKRPAGASEEITSVLFTHQVFQAENPSRCFWEYTTKHGRGVRDTVVVSLKDLFPD